MRDALPLSGQRCQVEANDGSGDYRLPFPVRFVEGRWINDQWGTPIVVKVHRWRIWLGKRKGKRE